MNAYLVIITWPSGIEGLLFPRPGNVKMATTPEEGQQDFKTAREHLDEYQKKHPQMPPMRIRLQRFEFKETISEVTL